ncbi:hypothetical protein [Microlunatus parietis]|uniref:Uncharacterized protein n=1 Tax=Microlunatus parietis TaxID=682979 RepID=A0A7Y9I295_9ACTN|nr:hypothetical protein [Microlunatus parietis]NYE68858.1 hypothetical protein [Microlunatus parietis]
MDLTLLTGLVVGLGGAAAGVIAALASYQKATASRTTDRSMLLIIFDTLESKGALDLLPPRVRRYLRTIAGQDSTPGSDDDAESSVDA